MLSKDFEMHIRSCLGPEEDRPLVKTMLSELLLFQARKNGEVLTTQDVQEGRELKSRDD